MQQEQRIEGDGAVGVQIDGSNNTVTLFAPSARLVLDRRHLLRRATARDERELLHTDVRAMDLVGRDEDLAALKAWLDGPMPVAVQCRTGRAGIGKTRLAIELCERAEVAGWTAGFARADELKRFFDAQNLTAWRWSRDTLVVVDYAAASARVLRAWLEVLARRPDVGEPKLRLLLLERHADAELGWWADLTRRGGLSGRGPDALLAPPEPLPVHSLHALAHRRALLAQTMAEAGRLRGRPVPKLPDPGANPDFDRRLADDSIGNEPLYLVMAGWVALDTGAPAALALGGTDLAHRVAEAEADRLGRLARSWGLSERQITHLAACVTLEGGCTFTTAQVLIEGERPALGELRLSTEEIAEHLADALPGVDGIDAVRPDLIGEAFLLQTLTVGRRRREQQAAIVGRAWQRAGIRVVATVIRTVQDHAGDHPQHPSLLWFDHLASMTDDPFALILMDNELPQKTLSLRERAADLSLEIATKLATLRAADPDLAPLLASSLGTLAMRLSELGRHEDALAAAEQAVAHYRDLAAQRPDAFTPDLAGSLNNLAISLSELGLREDALDAAEQAVAHYSDLAARRPDAFTPDLARSFGTLAIRLSELGRCEDALAAAEQAVAHYRDLAARRPDAFTPDLAGSLGTLAGMLSELGRREDALAAAEQAVAHYRDLTARRPDAFTPDLAGSLNNLAGMLSELGRREDALAAAEQAVAICRDLAAQRPDAFTPDLASSLNTLAIRLSELGRREDALDAAEQAVAHYRDLAAQRPDVFRPDLAASLAVIANCWKALGKIEEALQANGEAITTLSGPFLRHPAAFAHRMHPMIALYLERASSGAGIWICSSCHR